MSNQTVIRVLPDRNKIKPFYKKWWFWLIIFLVALVIFAAIISENKKKQTEDNNSVETTQTEMSEMDYKSSCKTIDYKTLARNPNKYKGDHFKITGEVEQVIEEDNVLDDNTQYTVRLNMTKNDLDYWDDTILLNVEIPQDEDRILEDDIITVYGTCQGKYTYTGLFRGISSKCSLNSSNGIFLAPSIEHNANSSAVRTSSNVTLFRSRVFNSLQ